MYIYLYVGSLEIEAPKGMEKSTLRISQKQNILDSIQEKRNDLLKLKKINAIQSTGVEGNLYDNIFHNRDVDMINKEISVQEDILNMVENVMTDVMTGGQGSYVYTYVYIYVYVCT
jgi:hypothetical protein